MGNELERKRVVPRMKEKGGKPEVIAGWTCEQVGVITPLRGKPCLILASPSPWKLQKGERPGKGTRDTGRVKERGYCGS